MTDQEHIDWVRKKLDKAHSDKDKALRAIDVWTQAMILLGEMEDRRTVKTGTVSWTKEFGFVDDLRFVTDTQTRTSPQKNHERKQTTSLSSADYNDEITELLKRYLVIRDEHCSSPQEAAIDLLKKGFLAEQILVCLRYTYLENAPSRSQIWEWEKELSQKTSNRGALIKPDPAPKTNPVYTKGGASATFAASQYAESGIKEAGEFLLKQGFGTQKVIDLLKEEFSRRVPYATVNGWKIRLKRRMAKVVKEAAS